MPKAAFVHSTPRTVASEFLIQVNRLQISLMIRDPFVASAFRRAEDDGLAPALVEPDHPRSLDGGAAEIVSEKAAMTSQEQANELLREWQERRGRGIAPARRLDTKEEKINDGEVTIASLHRQLGIETHVHRQAILYDPRCGRRYDWIARSWNHEHTYRETVTLAGAS
jgi:hypothetical protein